jgi:hypothetical protein
MWKPFEGNSKDNFVCAERSQSWLPVLLDGNVDLSVPTVMHIDCANVCQFINYLHVFIDFIKSIMKKKRASKQKPDYTV